MGNPTPGPSALSRNVNAHGGVVVQGRSNVIKKLEDREREKAVKRPSSEEPLDEEERERKRGRFLEGFDDNDATNPRDNKEKKRKRRKKRKKPISVVAGSSETSQRSEHEVIGLGLHSSSETLVKVNGVKVEDDSDDKAPTYSVCSCHRACLFHSSSWLIPFSFSSRLIRGKARRSPIHPSLRHLKSPILIIATLDLGVTLDRILVRLLLKVLINFLRLLVSKSNLRSNAKQVMILVSNFLFES